MSITNLVKPIITEKSMILAQSGQFSFSVGQQASKSSIKVAVEAMFKVNVLKVNVINLPAKMRRSGKKRLSSTTGSRKRAIVTLKSGQMIEYFKLPEEKKKGKKPASTAKRGK